MGFLTESVQTDEPSLHQETHTASGGWFQLFLPWLDEGQGVLSFKSEMLMNKKLLRHKNLKGKEPRGKEKDAHLQAAASPHFIEHRE